jgi:hypothetical protein
MARKKHGYVSLGVTVKECVIWLILMTEVSLGEVNLQSFIVMRKTELLSWKDIITVVNSFQYELDMHLIH